MRSPFPYFSIFMCVGLLSNRQGIDPKVPRNALARTNGQMVKTLNKLLRALWKSRERGRHPFDYININENG